MVNEPSENSFRWSPRQVMLATLFIVSVGIGFWLLFRFRNVFFILFVAIVIGTAIRPAVDWLFHRGVPRLYGQILIYVLILTLLAGFLLLALPLVLEQSTSIARQLSEYYNSIRGFMVHSPSLLLQRLGFKLPPQFQIESLVPENSGQTGQPPSDASRVTTVAQAFVYAGVVIGSILTLTGVFLMSFYWVLEGDRAIRSIMLLVPKDRREELRGLLNEILAKLGGYIFGLSVLSLSVGLMALVAYTIIGLPSALALALIAGVMEVVPVVGPGLGALPALLMAFSIDPTRVIWVVIATAIIQFIENYLLVPRVMGRSVGVHPLLTLLSLATLSSIFGIPGALMAIPVAALIQILFNRYVIRPQDEAALAPEGRDYLSLLRFQTHVIAQDLRKSTRYKARSMGKDGRFLDGKIEDSVEEIANELERILSQSGDLEMGNS